MPSSRSVGRKSGSEIDHMSNQIKCDTPPGCSQADPQDQKSAQWTHRVELIARSPEETFELGRKIAEQVEGRAVFLLSGELGAGKTIFAKGIAAGLGVDPVEVTSPSFTLIDIHQGRVRLYHIDLYRLEPGAPRELGLDEIFEEEAVVVVEWAERLNYAPADAIWVQLEYLSDSERKIIIQSA
jgi:tRNA threonylcarbamoyladenosine biosynthesis protein TsaE